MKSHTKFSRSLAESYPPAVYKFGMMKIAFFFLFLILGLSCSHDKKQPNLLVLTLDTLRADALGCYGNPTVQTPHLDRLASEGVLFEDAICQIPATLTSHTAMFTGLYPRSSGVRFRTNRVPAAEDTLAEIFTRRGYQTAAFISSYVLEPAFGLDQGFEIYDLGSMRNNGQIVNAERRAEETISAAISFLEQPRGKPFFLWVHLYDPHSPYDAPAPYSTLYDPNYDGPIRGTVQEITRLNATQGSTLTERDLQHLHALYQGEVAYMDHHIGRLLGKMEEMQLLEQTIIAAIADHGEALGEEGRFFHGEDLYQPAVKIPFLLRYPAKIEKGMRMPNLVQSIDLFPTLIELAGLSEKTAVDGRSLLPLLAKENDKREKFENRPGFLETEADRVCETNKLFGIRTEQYKFINNSAYRRPETPLGVFTEIPLKGPAIVLLRIKGDPSVRLMAHIRYRTKELYTSRDFQALAQLNTTLVTAESIGTDPLHNEAMRQESFLPAPPGWRLQASPDLYRTALQYGQARGWPTDWMVIEGVGVDASLPYNQTGGTFAIDQIELYAPTLKFPNSPKYRKPFWVIEDFEESSKSRGLSDSQSGPPHTTTMTWTEEKIFGGARQQQVEITFKETESQTGLDELFHLINDPTETTNLIKSDMNTQTIEEDNLKIRENCLLLLNHWRNAAFGDMEILELDESQRQALESLGYTR
ncbi:MAG: hypothetical protein C4527_13005 [Candidatus Omnitrophota bacterium]|jgi:arylsulfatase A-like enzyme|nr:MAG: hypothetical protein C4527_13005 [Candidatus Omnitrophota bacterium]